MRICPGCERHVFGHEPSCPFCAEPLRSRRAPGAVIAIVVCASFVVTGCVTRGLPEDSGDGGSTTGPSTDDPNPTASGSITHGVTTDTFTTSPTVTDSGDDTVTTTAPDTSDSGWDDGCGGFYACPPDIGDWLECDLFLQDCPDGEKCMPWANDGGNSWNATRCSPLDPDPATTGESCAVEGTGVSGVDDCGPANMCWSVDPMTDRGTCVEFCQGSLASPICADPDTLCVVYNNGVLPLCLNRCDPLLSDCPAGEVCTATAAADGFVCILDASGVDGAYGDPCEYANACDPGLFCANSPAVPGCTGSGCCSDYCDLRLPDPDLTCSGYADGQRCVPWWDVGTTPPGYEHVGACAIP